MATSVWPSVVWMRHINNVNDEDDNPTWHNWGHGSVRRMHNVPEVCQSKLEDKE